MQIKICFVFYSLPSQTCLCFVSSIEARGKLKMLTEENCHIKTAFYFMFPLMLQSSIVGETGKSSTWELDCSQGTVLGYNTVLKICFSFSGFLPDNINGNLETREKHKVKITSNPLSREACQHFGNVCS